MKHKLKGEIRIVAPLFFALAIWVCLVGCRNAENSNEVEISLNDPELIEDDKPIQHMTLADITSQEKAVEVLKFTTDQLKSKKKLDASEMHEIHMITYSLEKAITYFTKNSTGDQQVTARKMAEVIEEVHLNSENNRTSETVTALGEYFSLEEAFSRKF